MAVKIRLKVFGKKKKRFYRVVAADQRKPRNGETLETLGYYDPQQDPIVFEIKKDRVEHWMLVGATPTDTVQRLLATAGISSKKERKSSNQGIQKKDRKKETSETSKE